MVDAVHFPAAASPRAELPGGVDLGAFSVSLSVENLDVSQVFYENLGFVVCGGDRAHNYLILKNGETTIGLFHGMFEGIILTFNPGLNNRMERKASFTDIRQIESDLVEAGIAPSQMVDPESVEGAASLSLTDPDGNAILIDQFF